MKSAASPQPHEKRRRSVTIPLAFGDYDFPDRSLSQQHGRQEFLTRAALVSPKNKPPVLTALAGKPFTRYCDAVMRNSDPRLHALEIWLDGQYEFLEGYTPEQPLLDAIMSWADDYHLNVPWCLRVAGNTLGNWLHIPQLVGKQWTLWGGYSDPFVMDEKLQFRVTTDVYSPLRHKRAEYKAQALQQIEQLLDEYLDQIEAVAKDNGFERAPQRGKDHFDWLAYFQVGGYSFREIASRIARPSTSRINVSRNVRETADLIGLPIRPHADNE